MNTNANTATAMFTIADMSITILEVEAIDTEIEYEGGPESATVFSALVIIHAAGDREPFSVDFIDSGAGFSAAQGSEPVAYSTVANATDFEAGVQDLISRNGIYGANGRQVLERLEAIVESERHLYVG